MKIRELTQEDLKKMTEDHYALNPERPVRPDIKEALEAYAYKGRELGDFLTAVVANDLMEAMGRADSYNRATIHQICSFIYNELPSTCHGSPEKVLSHYRSFASEDEEQ